jgi:hypothetical protein
VGAQTAAVCGDWNAWSADADVMRRDAAGGFSLTVDLDAGRAYRFRYFLDGQRWDNDWAADAYIPNSFGGDDSVVDLTALVEPVPAAAKKAPVKKSPAKKQAAAHKQATSRKPKKAAPGAEPAVDVTALAEPGAAAARKTPVRRVRPRRKPRRRSKLRVGAPRRPRLGRNQRGRRPNKACEGAAQPGVAAGFLLGWPHGPDGRSFWPPQRSSVTVASRLGPGAA